MRIMVWPAGSENDAVAQYRLLKPAEALMAQGADVVISRAVTVIRDHPEDALPDDDDPIIGIYPPYADVVVMQRPSRRWWADIIPHLQSYGIRVVVDVDDRFDRIHKDHVGRADYDPTVNAINNYRWVDLACQRADLVTVTTPALLQKYGYGHGVVLPNLVPANYLLRQPANYPLVGWTGNVQTHAGDLEAAGKGVGRVVRTHGWHIHVVGTGNGVGEKLGVQEQSACGWVSFKDYPLAMSQIGIGIVPLADTQFNRAKSCLKMIEFASLGIPVVASATPDNRRMHKEGVGLLAHSQRDFERHLTDLIRSPLMRSELAAQGRETMSRFTYEAHAGRWLEAWESTVQPVRKAA